MLRWLFIILSLPLFSKEFIVLHCRNDAGMFSAFDDVLCLVKQFDKGIYAGIEVNFQKEGLFYSKDHGENWWTYYCKPLILGQKNKVRHVCGDTPGSRPWEIERHTKRQEANTLIRRYIHFKPEILSFVRNFQKEHFEDHFVLAIHYRGTDKIVEAPRITYQAVLKNIQKILDEHATSPYKIFVATDEEAFLQTMINIYGDRVCFNPNATRSTTGKPLHFQSPDPYQCGLEAIIDALLLSKGNYLIRTSSNLSRWSTYFNPSLPVTELSQRKEKKLSG